MQTPSRSNVRVFSVQKRLHVRLNVRLLVDKACVSVFTFNLNPQPLYIVLGHQLRNFFIIFVNITVNTASSIAYRAIFAALVIEFLI